MSSDAIVRIVVLCVVLAGAETLHGIARTTLVIPRIGKERAIQLSALTGTLLAFATCWMLVPGINTRLRLSLGRRSKSTWGIRS